ncbi:MAG: methyltransferase family protein [Promethearchaeota archaeon]
MGDYKFLLEKSAAVLLVLFYMNSIFIFLSPEVFTALETLVPIVLLSVVVCIDVAIRSVSNQSDRFSRATVGLAFLLFPLMVAFPYYEWKFFLSTYIPDFLFYMLNIGVAVLLIGAAILLVSRVQIGIYGGSKITIEESHRLITEGMYSHIRNPQYLGFILLFAGYSVSLGSLIVSVVTVVGLFIVFRSRLLLEEKLLLETFGEEYAEYLRRTKRLLPRVY